MKNSQRHGYGTETYPDGNIYEGEYKDDRRNGKGTYKHHDGAKYVGEFKNNLPHGKGTAFASDNTILQEGEWFEGAPPKGTETDDDIVSYEGEKKRW